MKGRAALSRERMLAARRRAYHGSMRVEATEAAEKIVGRVRASGRENLVMILSNGCCDATAPYLYDDYIAEPDAQPIGAVGDVAVHVHHRLALFERQHVPRARFHERVHEQILRPPRFHLQLLALVADPVFVLRSLRHREV